MTPQTKTTAPVARPTVPTSVWDGDRRPLEEPLPPIAQLAPSADELKRGLAELGDTLQALALRSMPVEDLSSRMQADRWPIPQSLDREGYFSHAHPLFWLSGLADQVFLAGLVRSTRDDLTILDFGAGSGRVVRHFGAEPKPGQRTIAADVNRRNIAWMRAHLDQPNLELLQTTYYPPLPLESESVDLIYALSVFTHIDEFEEAWLSEMRRILRPGGRAFLTFHSERTWSMLANPQDWLGQLLTAGEYILDSTSETVTRTLVGKRMPAGRLALLPTSRPYQYLNIFHSSDYVQRRWGAVLQVEQMFERVHGPHQDGVLLRKSD